MRLRLARFGHATFQSGRQLCANFLKPGVADKVIAFVRIGFEIVKEIFLVNLA